MVSGVRTGFQLTPTALWVGTFVQDTSWISLPDSLRASISQGLVREKFEDPPWHFSVSNCVCGENNHHPEFQFGEETCLKLHGHKRAELGFELFPIK